METSTTTATNYFQVKEGKISFEDTGDEGSDIKKPVVFCIPGMGDLRSQFSALSELLKKEGYRVISSDLRGLGQSQGKFKDFTAKAVGEDTCSLIESLHISDSRGVIIIGNSMAAAAAVWVAAELPNKVRKLIFLGPFVRDHPMNFFLRGLLSIMFRGFWGPAMWVSYYSSLFKTNPASPKHTQLIRSNLWEGSRLSYLRQMLFASKSTCTARIPEVKSPVLIIMGMKDPDFQDPVKEVEWIENNFKSPTKRALIEGAGHYPHVEFPEKIKNLIVEFDH